MLDDSDTLKEIEQKVEDMRKQFISTLQRTVEKDGYVSSLRNSEELFQMNRELCVYRSYLSEVKDCGEKTALLKKISEVDKAIFSTLHYPEPKMPKIRYRD